MTTVVPPTPLLCVRQLHAFYGKSHVLQGVSFDVAPGEVVAVLGRNGAGRSTLAKAIMGLVSTQGQAQWSAAGSTATNLVGKAPYAIAQLGVGYVPEGRDIFATLTVEQNLRLGQKPTHWAAQWLQPLALKPKAAAKPQPTPAQTPWTIDDAYALFPRLKERAQTPAGVLSGGEQQMLSVCRSLMGQPQLLIVDEPTEGLAPMVVEQVAQFLWLLKQRGIALLVIEQKRQFAMQLADRCLLMGRGRIVFDGPPAALMQAEHAALRAQWLEVAGG